MNKYESPLKTTIFNQVKVKNAVAIIVLVGVASFITIFVMMFFGKEVVHNYKWVQNLPMFNVFFNSLSIIFLLLGYNEIKKRNFAKHSKYVIFAFIASSFFLVGYLIHAYFTGDSKFMGEGVVRPIYFFILISHIILSAFVVPLVLTSFFLALKGKFELHKKVSRFTFPIWLYVSVTGIVVFIFLRIYN